MKPRGQGLVPVHGFRVPRRDSGLEVAASRPGYVRGLLLGLTGFMAIPLDHFASLRGKTKILSPCWTVTSVAETRHGVSRRPAG